MTLRTIIFTACLFLNSLCNAQSYFEKEQFDSLFTVNKHRHFIPSESTNEIRFVLNTLYKGYKLFISSQDSQSCSFTPSCSEYAAISIQQKGVFEGALMGFDRLMRCNGFKSKLYIIDPKTGLKIDPVW